MLPWATSSVFGDFIVLAVALNLIANHRQDQADVAAGVTEPAATAVETVPGAVPTPAPIPAPAGAPAPPDATPVEQPR